MRVRGGSQKVGEKVGRRGRVARSRARPEAGAHVLRLHVTVDDAVGVEVMQGPDQLLRDELDLQK